MHRLARNLNTRSEADSFENSHGFYCEERTPWQLSRLLEKFDLVYSLGVVEHFPETKVALGEHVRVLKKGGTILVTVPRVSFSTPFRFLNYLRKYRHRGTFEQTLGRNYRVSSLAKIISDYGISVVAAKSCGFYIPGVPQKIRKAIEPYLPSVIFGSYVVVIGVKT